MTTSQAFVYKAGKAPELHDKDVADRMKAEEGWSDNPSVGKEPSKKAASVPKEEADAETKPAPKPKAKKPAKKPAKGK